MERFVKIADGLDVGPALAQLDALPAIHWAAVHGPADLLVPLLGPDGRRRHGDTLSAVWALIEEVHARAVRDFGDRGGLDYARVGRLPPGGRILPHADGHDGDARRRYQLVLRSGPRAEIVLDGEGRNLRPGEAWQMDTSKVHWVANHDDEPRITLVFDTRAPD